AGLFELAHRPDHIASVDLEALGARVDVAGAPHAHRPSRPTVGGGGGGNDPDHTAALVWDLFARVGEHLTQHLGGDVHDSPPNGGVEVLDLLDGQGVDAARQVLPAVVGDDEHDIALVQLAGDAHRHARDRAGGDAREDALLVEQLARPQDRVVIGYEDLAVEQGEVDDRRDEAVVQR